MKVEDWILKINNRQERKRLLELRQRYEFLSKQLFHEYQPTIISNDETINTFMQRLEQWLDRFENENDQIVAFRSIVYFFFAGTKEFNELYRCASVEIERWIISHQINLNPFISNTHKKVQTILRNSWICPVTDSLRINDFLHITNLNALDFRADWYNLSKVGDTKKIRKKSKNVKYLILLDDFTGSGNQISKVLQFALGATELEILLISMIACAPGAKKVTSIIEKNGKGRVNFFPIVVLEENCLVGLNKNDGEPKLFESLRNVIETYTANWNPKNAYGFGKVGSLATTYSNCPNNTPLIYHKTIKNNPALFPRLNRNG